MKQLRCLRCGAFVAEDKESTAYHWHYTCINCMSAGYISTPLNEELKQRRVKDKMSIIELSVLAKKLGIDVDAIREKHYSALFKELLDKIKEKEVKSESSKDL